MSVVFVDRESAYPNRYRVIPESGDAYHVILERDDEPVTPGTPLNAETFNEMLDEIDKAKAPAGFGLGTDCAYIDSFENITKSGFYIGYDGPFEGAWYGYASVTAGGEYVTLEVWYGDGTRKYKRTKTSGVWGEWQNIVDAIGARPNTWLPTIAEIGAAPEGYGLGTIGRTIKTSAELDALVVNYNFLYAGGNFDDSITIDGYTITYGYGRTDTYNETGGKQTLTPLVPRIDTTLVRYLVSGVWGEWEWENPPMSPNVEYRTTELHNGKVVFTKLVQFGALPNKTEKSVTVMPAGASLIEAVGYGSGGSYNVPIPGYYGIQSIGSTRSSGTLWLSTTIDMSSYNGWITIKYHKG